MEEGSESVAGYIASMLPKKSNIPNTYMHTVHIYSFIHTKYSGYNTNIYTYIHT